MAGSKETPVMRQWREAKDRFPDAIILTRIGDFYEAMMEDAADVARILGITLTNRNNGSASAVPLAGFPIKALDAHVPRLLAAGRRIAILEQVEDPAEAKGVVRREVTDVITPGVVVEDSMLSERTNNYIASFWTDGHGRTGVAIVDASTGEVILADGSNGRREALLSRFQPAELLVAADAVTPDAKIPVMSRAPWTFDPERGEDEIRRLYGIADIESFGLSTEDAHLVGAFGGLLSYLREVRPSGLGEFRAPQIDRGTDAMQLDRMTIQNLELLQPLRGDGDSNGTLFGVLDRTVTPMGARLLRRWILEPLLDIRAIEDRQEAVAALLESNFIRKEVRQKLSKVRDLERITSRVTSGRASARDLRVLVDSIEPLDDLAKFSDLGSALLDETVGRMDPLDDVYMQLSSALPERPAASSSDGDIISDGYNQELDELRSLRRDARDHLAALQQQERERTGISNLKIGHNRVHGYYLEIPKSQAAAVPESYERRQTLANAERYVTPQLRELEERIVTAAERIEAIQAEIFASLRQYVAGEAKRIIESAAHVALFDVVAALADVAHQHGYCRPEMHRGYEMTIAGGRHPVVETMMPREDFIPNDVRLGTDRRLILLTGPNMGGKSTLLRQVGLIQIMAQIGSYVPADSARLSVCDRVFTRVGASDDLASGKSTFMVEMSELAAIVHGATSKSLCLLDEIGRGTSTAEGSAIAAAAAETLLERIQAKTIFATHYHELTELENRLDGLANQSMVVREHGNDIVFLHAVTDGPADRSYGVEVARMAGLPSWFVSRAGELLAQSTEARPRSDTAVSQSAVSIIQKDEVSPAQMRALEVLSDLDVNATTPLDALRIIADVKKIMNGEEIS